MLIDDLKIALVVDWLVDVGGAEKVNNQILNCFPEADVFSSVDFMQEKDRWVVHNKKVTTSFIQKLPTSKSYRKFLPLMPFAMENLDLSGYDVIISSSSSVAKSVTVGPDQLHICYCHSPMRYAWDMQNEYLEETGNSKGLKSYLMRYLLYKMRSVDFRTSNSVDHFIANSNYISKRIEKCYRRDSVVIYPNVEVDDFTLVEEKEDYYFTCSRMVPYKKIDLIVKTFSQLPDKKLIVIGDGPDFNKVSSLAGDNVTLLGYQDFATLKKYMSNAKAFVYAAKEDFGIVPVEAQACGTPVIAFGEGGLRETVVEGKTGLFFYEQSVESLTDAIEHFERLDTLASASEIRDHSLKFSTERFRQEFRSFVLSKLKAAR